MADKLLINSVENCARECLFGFSKLHSHLTVDFETGVVIDVNECGSQRVAVISGGGSGHEPFPSGFVGHGMLTASVSGLIFTCPPSSHVLHAIRFVASKSAGVLLLVPNYTGDVLNFGLAAENAIAEGLRVESVIVGDDVAQNEYGNCSKVGRRGMCGLVLLIKVIGYLSVRGDGLTKLHERASELLKSIRSMGLCVTACSKPGVGRLFHLEEDEVEVGVGVHGEAGVHRRKMLSATEAVRTLLDYILSSLQVYAGDEVIALVNNLGSLSYIEEWLLAGEVENQLKGRGFIIARLYSGRFFTSINMSGVQICVLKLNEDIRETILSALDYPTTASAWPRALRSFPSEHHIISQQRYYHDDFRGPQLSSDQSQLFIDCLINISRDFKIQENRLNMLDSVCGDGDCGSTFSRIASLIQSSINGFNFSDPRAVFSGLCASLEESVGGTSGALYGLFFRGISQELMKHYKVNMSTCAKCWRAGVDLIKKYSSARLGDRTMLDSLESGCEALEKNLQEEPTKQEKAFKAAVEAAMEGCQRTISMKAKAGRASYSDQRHQREVDAGAYAVTVWLSAIQRALNERQG